MPKRFNKSAAVSTLQVKRNGSAFFQPAQPGLVVNRTNDAAEQEAETAANHVMQMPASENSFFRSPTNELQRKCSCGQEEKLQMKGEKSSTGGSTAPATVSKALHSTCESLDGGTRSLMESRFGYDFSNVQVHNDSIAHQSSEDINALAYTHGDHIVFGKGQYEPSTNTGKKLIAHELTHVVQQGSAVDRKEIQRQTGSAPAPAYGSSCSGGATDPCQYSRCDGKHEGIFNDLLTASNYAITAAGALNQSPLSQNTIRALDWYFSDHSQATADTVAQRLRCIALCLIDSYANNQYGCDPDHSNSDIAYVCVGSTPMCEDATTNICLANIYFGKSDRIRAEALVHECGHRIGLSLGSDDDIYDHDDRFLGLTTEQALTNTDSFALFASAIVNGFRTNFSSGFFPLMLGVGGGVALSGGAPTWYARINYFNIGFQNPVLEVFSPNLGVSATLIGESTSPDTPGVTASTSFLASLTAGFRIENPKPGPIGGPYFSFWGGPSLAIGLGTATSDIQVGLGAEAGVAGGFKEVSYDQEHSSRAIGFIQMA
jgi:hypothetical protein